MICSECGLVVGDRVIDVGSEWRTFSNEKSGVDPSRVGGPENPLLSGGDLSTIIGPGTGSASFDSFGSPKYQNRRTMSSSDRSLISAFKEISMMADRINLPKTIVDRANNLFKQVNNISYQNYYILLLLMKPISYILNKKLLIEKLSKD